MSIDTKSDPAGLIGCFYGDLKHHEMFEGVDIPEVETIEDRSYLSIPEVGMSFVLPDHSSIEFVQLYEQGFEGFSQYKGKLPAALSWNMDRQEVRSLLGLPRERGERGQVPPLGEMPAWDAFIVGNTRLHVEYRLDGTGIRLITLGAACPS